MDARLQIFSYIYYFPPPPPPFFLLFPLTSLPQSFSTNWFLFAKPTNHYLVFYLLEIFNNVIQYQFDGQFIYLHVHVCACACDGNCNKGPSDRFFILRNFTIFIGTFFCVFFVVANSVTKRVLQCVYIHVCMTAFLLFFFSR